MIKGSLVLRDVLFMIVIFSGIIALSSIAVTQVADTYGNTNMSNSFNQNNIGNETLIDTGNKWEGIAENLSGENGIRKLVKSGLQAVGIILIETIKAPATFSSMLVSLLEIVGVDKNLQDIAGFILTTLLYVLIIFAIIKVFLQGGDI